MIENKRVSLCISYPDLHNEIRFRSFRIGDYCSESNCYKEAKYSELSSTSEYNPKYIKCKPSEVLPLEPVIREWWTIEGDYVSVLSKLKPLPVYEIIFSDIAEKKINEDEARKIIETGFSLPEGVSETIIFVIGKSPQGYVGLIINKKDLTQKSELYSYNSNAHDWSHMCHKLDVCYLQTKDYFSTEHADIAVKGRDSRIESANTRYFYKYSEIVETNYFFNLKSIQDYFPAYLHYYLKRNKSVYELTKKDYQNIIEIIEDAINDTEVFEKFRSETGFSTENIIAAFTEGRFVIENYFDDQDELLDTIEYALTNNQDFYDMCIEVVSNNWLHDKSELRDDIDQEINGKKNELTLIKNDYEHFEMKSKKLIADTIELDQKLSEKKIELNGITDKLKNEMDKFENDFIEKVKFRALLNVHGNSESKQSLVEEMCYEIKPKLLDEGDNVFIIEDLGSLVDDMEENFYNIGINEKFTSGLSEVICALLKLGKHLILHDNGSNEIASAISALINNVTPTQLFLPLGFNDINYIAQRIQNSDSYVVVIHNAFDAFSDLLCRSLTKIIKNKFLIFTYGNPDLINEISYSIESEALILDTRNFISNRRNNKMLSSSLLVTLLEHDTNFQELNVKYKSMCNLGEKGIISNSCVSLFALIESLLNPDSTSTANKVILYKMCHQAIRKDQFKFFEENFRNYDDYQLIVEEVGM